MSKDLAIFFLLLMVPIWITKLYQTLEICQKTLLGHQQLVHSQMINLSQAQ